MPDSTFIWHFSSMMRAAFRGWAELGGFTKIFLCIFVVIVGALSNSGAFSGPVAALLDAFKLEKDHAAPADYGYGPGAGVGAPRPNLRLGQTPIIPKSFLQPPANPVKAGAAPNAGAVPNAVGAVPTGGGTGGFFGPAFPWPIIPIHVALLPDGRVLNFGTDQQGNQGAQLVYDVWDPNLGNGTNAHTTLTNTTSTDIFCSAASLLSSGTVLITGGDLTVNGVRNFSNNKVEIFNPSNNRLTASGQMNYPRWYDSTITLPNGNKLVLGGSVTPNVGEPTPEVFSATTGWRTLSGISISDGGEWYYPRGVVGADYAVYLPEHYSGTIFRLTTDGAGTMQDTGSRLDPGADYYPSLMFNNAQGNPFSVLTVRNGKKVQLVDVSQSPPVVTRSQQPRL